MFNRSDYRALIRCTDTPTLHQSLTYRRAFAGAYVPDVVRAGVIRAELARRADMALAVLANPAPPPAVVRPWSRGVAA